MAWINMMIPHFDGIEVITVQMTIGRGMSLVVKYIGNGDRLLFSKILLG